MYDLKEFVNLEFFSTLINRFASFDVSKKKVLKMVCQNVWKTALSKETNSGGNGK